MQPTATYRVVGVRADGTKRVLCKGISARADAERLVIELRQHGTFPKFAVELDGDDPLEQQPQAGELNW